MKKETKFVWDEKCDEAFRCPRDGLTKAPILKFLDFNKKFTLHTDASLEGLGLYLTQADENNIPHLIGFGGRSLNQHKKNYTIHKLEALALITGNRYFQQYLNPLRYTVIAKV